MTTTKQDEIEPWVYLMGNELFSGAKSTPAGIPQTNALGENRQFSLQIMFTSCPFNSATVRYFPSKFAHMHLWGIHYQ